MFVLLTSPDLSSPLSTLGLFIKTLSTFLHPITQLHTNNDGLNGLDLSENIYNAMKLTVVEEGLIMTSKVNRT